jgi:hypothetical protein
MSWGSIQRGDPRSARDDDTCPSSPRPPSESDVTSSLVHATPCHEEHSFVPSVHEGSVEAPLLREFLNARRFLCWSVSSGGAGGGGSTTGTGGGASGGGTGGGGDGSSGDGDGSGGTSAGGKGGSGAGSGDGSGDGGAGGSDGLTFGDASAGGVACTVGLDPLLFRSLVISSLKGGDATASGAVLFCTSCVVGVVDVRGASVIVACTNRTTCSALFSTVQHYLMLALTRQKTRTRRTTAESFRVSTAC